MSTNRMIFTDRKDAAVRLKEHLPRDRMKQEKWHLVAVSSGGLELMYYMNERLNLAKDFLFSAGIYAPKNSECELARVSEHEEIVINDSLVKTFDIKYDYIYGEASRKYEEKILSYIYKYRKGKHFEDMEGRTILLVDEGAESGLKLMAAIKTVLAMRPKAVYVAVPVLPSDLLDSLEPLTDEIFFISALDDYIDTKSYYESFEPVTDAQIAQYLGE
ncbi:phosphoribosyltransferase [Sulfurimonas sp. HSL3-7]|uniref:phosphoribosyltransferase n=1 Tax=Sulfonitrofixus jiaomeiensis TaxID=3131938 RepID=UPI0031F88E75